MVSREDVSLRSHREEPRIGALREGPVRVSSGLRAGGDLARAGGVTIWRIHRQLFSPGGEGPLSPLPPPEMAG